METSGGFINLDDEVDEFSLVYNQLLVAGSGSLQEVQIMKENRHRLH
jgi:hypothetical protein